MVRVVGREVSTVSSTCDLLPPGPVHHGATGSIISLADRSRNAFRCGAATALRTSVGAAR